ncbi:hypothetical protein SAMN02745664_1248 [Moraxella cuniculi DSM 21768]|uniref:Uncharacterized protein n=1 Tax=Moraxella cuniculi DSM 21768 TaxID=1122245 RepID=A0A1N7G6A7_9GAMM|nr:hypothetical protein [Moraxella cuniculi]OOS04349.1 hypothetical protein B0189_08540 [Moraxella cuniculi]SIS08147.1 hypothetical protein SAMN02745664_1248 [Moraxella cuniculi DSM 21768]
MNGYKKGEIWVKMKTGEEVMLVRTVDNYVYCHDKKDNHIKLMTSEQFLDAYVPKSLVKTATKPRLLAWDAATSELLKTAIVMLCISLLVMANVALFRFLAG